MRGHVKPTDQIPIVRRTPDGGRRLDIVRWGLIPPWTRSLAEAAKSSTFNAKSETLAKLPTFREAFKRTRCLVVIDGWYEWIQFTNEWLDLGDGAFSILAIDEWLGNQWLSARAAEFEKRQAAE
jgi:putative SOS response-associated peptidase YedK